MSSWLTGHSGQALPLSCCNIELHVVPAFTNFFDQLNIISSTLACTASQVHKPSTHHLDDLMTAGQNIVYRYIPDRKDHTCFTSTDWFSTRPIEHAQSTKTT